MAASGVRSRISIGIDARRRARRAKGRCGSMHDDGDEVTAIQGSVGAQLRRARACLTSVKHRTRQANEQQARMGRQQEDPDLEREREPSSARRPSPTAASSAAGSRAHTAMVRMTGPKSGVGTEKAEMPIISRTGERRMLRRRRSSGRARRHDPIGHDHADLRECVDAEQAAAGEIV